MREGQFFVDRTDIDYFSAGSFVCGRGRHPIFDKRLSNEEQALQVDVQYRVKVGFGGVPEVGAAFEAGIVHQDVDLAELRGSVCDEFLHVRHASDVVLKAGDLPAGFSNVGNHGVGPSLV